MTVIGVAWVLLSPVAITYAWWLYFARMWQEPGSWRNRVTLVSLILVSLAILLWPVMIVRMPAADWRNGAEMGFQFRWIGARFREALYNIVRGCCSGFVWKAATDFAHCLCVYRYGDSLGGGYRDIEGLGLDESELRCGGAFLLGRFPC